MDNATFPGMKEFLDAAGNDRPKMLFLDDRTKRIEAAPRVHIGFRVTIVTNVKECLRYMSRADWDVISLDHDLHGCDFEDPDSPNVGMEVVRYLEKTGWPPDKHMPTFHVHSSNIFAAHLMVTRLHALGFFAEWHRFEYPDKDFHEDTQT